MTDLRHGTASAYRHGGCRCPECTEAARVQTAEVRARRRAKDEPTEAEVLASESLPGEEWRPAVGFEGYEVSSLGRVRSLKYHRPRLVAQAPKETGYLRVELWAGNRSTFKPVHKLVAEAFIGPCPEGEEVRHLNDDKANNALANLAYGTHRQNVHDSVRNGTQWNTKKTHCKHGHPFDAANTRLTPGVVRPKRRCITCERARHEKRPVA